MISVGLMGHVAHMQTLLPLLSCCLPLLERMLVQNISHENELIFMRMNVQVTYIFIQIVLHKDWFCHRGKVNYSSMSWLRESLILTVFYSYLGIYQHRVPKLEACLRTKFYFCPGEHVSFPV